MKKGNSEIDVGLNRFKQINRYNYITEQAAPPPPEEDPNTLPPPPEGEEPGLPPPPEDATGEEPAAEPAAEVEPSIEDDTTEEVDITDLVNMIKSVKKDLDEPKPEDPAESQKMDDVFTKLADLESKLGEMDSVLAKIDQLGSEIRDIKPKTPVEKLEMRSLDSYPFNQSPDTFFKDKKEEMKKTGKNEYVLTKNDVENYGKYDMMKSFNPALDNPY